MDSLVQGTDKKYRILINYFTGVNTTTGVSVTGNACCFKKDVVGENYLFNYLNNYLTRLVISCSKLSDIVTTLAFA